MLETQSAVKVVHVIKMVKVAFSSFDYVLFCLIIVFSICSGIYFGCFKRQQLTLNEYLLGNRQMKMIPILFSLVASHINGGGLMAIAADIYRNGAMFWLSCVSVAICNITVTYIFLPLLYRIKVISILDYLDRRFDAKTRILATALFFINTVVEASMVVYLMALNFAICTGANIFLMIWLVCGISTFYTAVGGFRAVIWNDVLQFVVMVGGSIALIIWGVELGGGFGIVWTKAIDSGRLDIFDFDPDPTKRESFWIFIIGLSINRMGYLCLNQMHFQRLLSVPTLKTSIKLVVFLTIGMWFFYTFYVFVGLVMYAKYSDCDPLDSKQIQKIDQLVPFYFMDIAKSISGVAGIYLANVISSGLSSISSALNSLSGNIYRDFINIFAKRSISEKTSSKILKVIVFLIGAVIGWLAMLTYYFENLYPIYISATSIMNGPMLGLFSLGALLPMANSNGAFYGTLSGVIFLLCITIPTKYYQLQGLFKYPTKPLSTENCTISDKMGDASFVQNISLISELNSTTNDNLKTISSGFKPLYIFRISFFYTSLMGVVVTVVLGLIISYMTKNKNDVVEQILISPASQCLVTKDKEKSRKQENENQDSQEML